MLMKGANMGKNIPIKEISHWMIDLVGRKLKMMLLALVWKPISPSTKANILVMIDSRYLGKLPIIFFPRCFTLSHNPFRS